MSYVFISVDTYDWVVNGEAKTKIQTFMDEDHTFEEYCKVYYLTNFD